MYAFPKVLKVEEQSEPACFSWNWEVEVCAFWPWAPCPGAAMGVRGPRGSCWGLGTLTWVVLWLGHLETRLLLVGLAVQLFTQNVKAQAALEA